MLDRPQLSPLLLSVLLGSQACSEAADDAAPQPIEQGSEPLYALQATVFNPDDSATSYIVLSNTLDLDRVSLENAREFPGRVVIEAAGGHLLVAEDGAPTVERFAISDSFEWSDVDDRLNFSNLGTPYITFDTLLRRNAAYTRLNETGSARVVWDPTGMRIVDTMEETAVPLEVDGIPLTWGAGVGFGLEAPPLWIFTYADEDYFDRGSSTFVALYDPKTHEEREVIEIDCPATDTPSRDEEGHIYLSNWDYWPTRALYGLGAPACVRRLNPDGTLDTEWKPDFTEWTGGRHLMAWYYLEDGIAIGNVLHHELLESQGADFDGEYDPDVYDEIENGEYYRPWLFDLNEQTARPMAEFSNILSALQLVELDGRFFVFLPHDNWTRMEVFEVEPSKGTAKRHFDVDAYLDGWVRIR